MMKHIEVTDGRWIREIRLNRPELHNAFNAAMISELTEAFRDVGADTRAVRFSGNGKSFCAGADLAWMKSMVDYDFAQNEKDALQLFDLFAAIRECPVPVVTYAHGNVFGGGLGLLACSDIVAVESATKFCFSEAKLGLAPAVISPFVMQKAAENFAREWMLTAKVFGADEAKTGGLVNFAGPQTDGQNYLQETLAQIVGNGNEAVRATKKLIGEIKTLNWEQRRRETARVIAERRVSEEGQEGLRGFLEKRSPRWKVDMNEGRHG